MVHLYTLVINTNQNENMKVEDQIRLRGGNTGNIVWFEAVKRSIKYDSIGKHPDMDAEMMHIVMPMANQIQMMDRTLEILATKLAVCGKGKYKITMIGLGSQLSAELNTPRKLVDALPLERKRALKELSYHSESIGIRGSITAECLELMDIRNYRIIGCPSFYVNRVVEAGNRSKISTEKLCVSWGSTDYSKEQYVRELFRCNVREGDALILQAMDDFPRTLYEDVGLLDRHIMSRYPDIAVLPCEIESYIKQHGHMFFDWDSWQNFLKKERFTLAVGCRFHGNMMAYLAGIPTVWIVHDSRTYELCETMTLPHISLEQARGIKSREQFAEYCIYGDEFDRNREQMEQTYAMFLRENKIERA